METGTQDEPTFLTRARTQTQSRRSTGKVQLFDIPLSLALIEAWHVLQREQLPLFLFQGFCKIKA